MCEDSSPNGIDVAKYAEDNDKGHVFGVFITQKDEFEKPFMELVCPPEATLDWLIINDSQGEILRMDEEFNIIYGDNYKQRMSKVFARKTLVPNPES